MLSNDDSVCDAEMKGIYIAGMFRGRGDEMGVQSFVLVFVVGVVGWLVLASSVGVVDRFVVVPSVRMVG